MKAEFAFEAPQAGETQRFRISLKGQTVAQFVLMDNGEARVSVHSSAEPYRGEI